MSIKFVLCLLLVYINSVDLCGQTKFKTLTGNSGKSIENYGIRQDVYGTWMGRSSWADLKNGNWLMVPESGNPKWRRDHFDRATDVGVPLIPHDSGQDLNELLKAAIYGEQDSTYLSLGAALAHYCSKTVFARIWWEFNMYPVKQDNKLFIAAWRRAIPLIRKGFKQAAVKGQILEIVWCTNAGVPNPEPFYPGDDVVDIIGSDTYGMVWGDADPSAAQMVHRILKDPYMLEWQTKFANAHKKPVCLGEWANVAKKGLQKSESHGIGDFPEYIDVIYDWIQTNKYGCRYVCYFNLEDGGILTSLDKTPKALLRLKERAAEANQK
ncbi:hypothetical protein ACVWYG_003176 [Pedobacter sp. UYEF25]